MIVTVATDVSFGHGDVPNTIYLNVLVVVPAKTVKVPAPELKVPPDPVNLLHVPPVCSPVMILYKSITVPEPSHSVSLPSVPADLKGLTFTVTSDVSLGQPGADTIYLKILVVAPVGIKVPNVELNVPPEPDTLLQTPPVESPEIKLDNVIVKVELSQTLVEPLVPATGQVKAVNPKSKV